MNSIVILGANGFVGKNLIKVLSRTTNFRIIGASHNPSDNQIWFDLNLMDSWNTIISINPDYIIDASGYGVIKDQTDLTQLFQINYTLKRDFFDYVSLHLPQLHWVQIGTAFEYSLEKESILENTICFPKTNYGISKWLFSNYLMGHENKKFTIFRPFGMFGTGEDISKFFPLLILAQKNKQIIDLSSGNQKRDYSFIEDFAKFINYLLVNDKIRDSNAEIINIGSGKPKKLFEFSEILKETIPNFNPKFWNWNAIPERSNENNCFFNASQKCFQLGFENSKIDEALKITVNYYFNS